MKKIVSVLSICCSLFLLTVAACDNGEEPKDPIEIIYPAGGEALVVGSAVTVKWKVNSDAVSSVGIKFSNNGIEFKLISDGSLDPSVETMSWTPTAAQVGTDCQIMAYDYTDETVFAQSESFSVEQ
jgi:hypothetical protein